MKRRFTAKTRELRELADDLTMLASQLREAAAGLGDPPSHFWLDDWMSRYRTAVRSFYERRCERPETKDGN